VNNNHHHKHGHKHEDELLCLYSDDERNNNQIVFAGTRNGYVFVFDLANKSIIICNYQIKREDIGLKNGMEMTGLQACPVVIDNLFEHLTESFIYSYSFIYFHFSKHPLGLHCCCHRISKFKCR